MILDAFMEDKLTELTIIVDTDDKDDTPSVLTVIVEATNDDT